MATSLEKLADNLAQCDPGKFREIKKIFNNIDIDLVTRKGIYPYEYTDSWGKLQDNCLPPESEFYSTLTESHINEADYQHALRVWNYFNFKTLGEYSDWYIKVDVMLLCDVFENFRDLCINTYGLDPNYYYTAPGMSFDCMLRHTEVELELLCDYDQILMIEAGIRGGLTQVSMQYACANNKEVPEYDPSKPDSWIVYLDATNLYGWAMSKDMPKGGFQWYNEDLSNEYILKLLENTNDTSGVGYALEVHRVLKFDQSPWLEKYIRLNTNMRKNAMNDFEREFFKLMNNAVFGKTLENVRNRIRMMLVCNEKKCLKLINLNTFKDITIYSENLVAIHLNDDLLKFDKPIYVGFSILDISKTLIYDFHYESMVKTYGDNIQLMYTDTDSLIYNIKSEDYYNDLLNNPDLLQRMDTSNFSSDHPCYCIERKKLPGTFTDECKGVAIREFIALRAKSYAYNLAGDEKIIAKGISGHVVKNHLSIADHKKCLFWDSPMIDEQSARSMAINQSVLFKSIGHTSSSNEYTPFRVNNSFRSYKHQMKTISTVKLALNRSDDKRHVLDDQIHTLAHGHYRIEEDKELERVEAEMIAMMEDGGY
ncbi:uncharacterized protein LOC111039957 [Myzus persicae]|uniref:uncharacterized protein LOC111039957 n=1 Tax=Myzus persicae TaxID=13164 RepID=UPI000B9357D3|nr:uncharacterized protein LOC111039957 [Myzus persicae]